MPSLSTRQARLAAAVGVLVLASGLTALGWWHSRNDEPRLIWPGDGGGVAGEGFTQPGGATSIGALNVCLSKPGSITVIGVAPIEPTGGLRVTAWAAHTLEDGLGVGAENKTLRELGYRVGGRQLISVDCASVRAGRKMIAEIAVQYTKSSPGDATSRGVRVTYLRGGQRATMVAPFAVALCDGSCEDLAPLDPVQP